MRRLVTVTLVLIPCLALAEDKKDPSKPTKEEDTLLELINKEREKEKLPALKMNEKLLKAARDHSANMATQSKMDHVLDGKEPKDRVKDAGYDYMHMGENVAYGQRSPADVVRVWMSSEGHRKNILRKEYTETGIAVARSKSGVPYYTQVFGTPLPR